jgi:phosphoribosylanthranilate isomerase
MTLVKICGISDPAHATAAVEAGADFVGVVFYPPSSRYVTTDRAREVAAALDGSRTRLVGLFVNETSETINRTVNAVGLDLVQLAGVENPQDAGGIDRPVIATIRADSSGRVDEERRFLAWTSGTAQPFAILLDAHVPGMYGGTGTVADWFVAAEFARRYPVVLAGGLTPATVGPAIHRVHPFGVDVSSGVETQGHKDIEKIRAFIAAVRQADADPISSVTASIDVPAGRGR